MADQGISQFFTFFSEMLNADCFLRWELQVLEENRHEEELYRTGKFFRFVAQLLEIHEASDVRDFSKALELLRKLEENFQVVENKLCILHRVPKVIEHIIHVSKATLLLDHGCTTGCMETLSTMRSRRDLNELEEAAILAIRSACLAMYSHNGTREALKVIDRAIRKDNKPFWRFLKALYLYKARKTENPTDPPSLEELELLKAVNEEEKEQPLFMVYLADVYRESADANKKGKELNFWYFPEETRSTLKEERENMYRESKALYEEAYKLRPKCPLIGFRVASGLMKLPQLYYNVKLAKEIIQKHPDENRGYGNIVEAFYQHQFGKKPELAKRCLEASMKLNVFNAHMNYAKLMFKENPVKFDIEILKKLLNVFEEAPKKKIIHAQLISYFLFASGRMDLKIACQSMMEYLKIGGPRNSLERHVSFFLDTSEPFSLVDVVADQVKFSVNLPNLQPHLRTFYRDFIHFTHFQNLSINWKSRPENIRKQILDKKIPDLRTRNLPEPRTNTNPKQGGNRAPNQPNVAGKTQYSKPGGYSIAHPKNFQQPKNTPGPSNEKKNTKFPEHIPVPPTTSNLERKPAPEADVPSNKRNDRAKDVREHEERKGRRGRHASVSSSDSDHDRRSRHKKKHHRHRRHSTSTSESDSRDRRHRSPSRSRRHREHKRRHEKHRHRRYSTSSDSSSTSYDKYKKKGRKHDRHRSYTTSEASSPERHGEKKSSHRSRERGEDKNVRKKMEQMSMGDLDRRSSRRE